MALRPISVTTGWDEAARGDGVCVLVPALARFPAAVRELMALLPVVDLNQALLSALAEARCAPPPGMAAGVFAVDPFLDRAGLIAALRASGVRRVANFPTVQSFDGATSAGFDVVGYDFRAELALMAALAEAGFEPLVYVAGVPAASAALEAGFTTLVYHPGLAPLRGERAVFAQVEQMAAQVGATLFQHQREPG